MMKKAILLVVLLPLAACDQHSERTKAWYLEHAAEREARVSECKNDAAQAASADCRNALDAKAQADTFGAGAAPSINVTPDRNRGATGGRDAPVEKAQDYSIDVTPKRPSTPTDGAVKPTQ